MSGSPTIGARVGRIGDGEQAQLGAGRGTIESLIGPSSGLAELDLHVNTLFARCGLGPHHVHTAASNIYVVLEGVLAISLGDERHDLGAGGYAYVPPGLPHSAGNLSDLPTRILEIYLPGVVDFVEVPQPDAPG